MGWRKKKKIRGEKKGRRERKRIKKRKIIFSPHLGKINRLSKL
jgi:hypothetical protein